MAWGPCRVNVIRERRTPRGFHRKPGSTAHLRPHCAEFYWNVGSAISKLACLTLFFIVEAPRRVLAHSARMPEPMPIFDCSGAGGFRICTCGHHFYEHKNLGEHPSDFAAYMQEIDENDPLEDPMTTKKNHPRVKSKHKIIWK